MSSIMLSWKPVRIRSKAQRNANITHNFVQRRRWNVPYVIEEIAICAQLAYDHDRSLPSVFRNADTELRRGWGLKG